jgi:Tol biopolymer transport system component
MQDSDTAQWRRLTADSASDDYPAWSPDGTEIAFGRSTMIYKVDTDGSNETRLASGDFPTWSPARPTWSPDGKHIAYSSGKDGIYEMNSDGSNPTLVVDNMP